jgi:hypothetical protein
VYVNRRFYLILLNVKRVKGFVIVVKDLKLEAFPTPAECILQTKKFIHSREVDAKRKVLLSLIRFFLMLIRV